MASGSKQPKTKPRKKLIRHNTAANQEKHRADWLPLQPNDLGIIPDRRIMPRDERLRRMALEEKSGQAISVDLGEADWQAAAADGPFRLGVVVEIAKDLCRVQVDGRNVLCDIRGTLTAEGAGFINVVAVGDRALLSLPEPDHGWVEQVLPRRSALARHDSYYNHLKQIIAANMEQVLIVASWRQPHLWRELIDEHLIGAARNNLHAVICINKIDLAQDVAECRAAVQAYADLGYHVIFTSAVTQAGLDALRDVLRDQSTVLAGLSGVGKSSLLSAIQPGFNLPVKSISRKRGQGRHTTTQAIMLPLQTGGYVVDTPGIRDLGLRGLYRDELITFYPEILPAAANCRFTDCSHIREDQCGVKAAVAEGRIAGWRYENYLKLYNKLPD
ncbi:MAG TPA: ribosome small subunit-dependent GTPase A [Anaerolineae bacterium]